MRVWIVETGEPLPRVDPGTRPWRCGMLSDALLDRRHEVRWWASTFDHARKRFRFPSARTIETRPGLTIRLLHASGYRRNIGAARWRAQKRLARLFYSEAVAAPRPDLIFCCLPTPDLAERAVRLGREFGVPVVVDVRDCWPDFYLTASPGVLRGAVRLALTTEFRRTARALREATGITAVSDTFMNWALGYANRRAGETDAVFPLGYQPQPAQRGGTAATSLQPEPHMPQGTLVVTFVGIFGASYDLETVVHAARELHRGGDAGIHFVLAGEGDKASQLRAKADGLSNVTFAGWLEQGSMAALLERSSVGLCAYTAGALQSLPNKPFEYMAAGLPLLSSLGGELETMIRTEGLGLQYEAGNVASLVEAVRRLAADSAARVEMGQRAQRLFEARFRADVVYPGLVRHIEHVKERFVTSLT